MDARIAADKIKQTVSCRQFLIANGIQIKRNSFCVCPFHGDTDASLKLYGDSWHCFGCHKHGDVITLAMELYGTGFMDAIRRLNDEFSVGLDIDSKTSDRDKTLIAFRKAINESKRKHEAYRKKVHEELYLNSLCMWMWLCQRVEDTEPDRDEEWNPLFRGYIQAKADAREQLIESDVRRMMLNG